ncbi:beta-lactamase/transpeptidase-like protein [Corynespora cassiicola Philippines]|uniref:Beta-lactamase/transpeptidase-like protein n=1 Tax=Corynespora cassiicola Philippines TaxID=1448308 RepID=A0A2T2NVE0_CORCC|nr:beta-lactamase/transpeptidase-like protein [Corynespora cassiicola Philippines]
MEKTVKRLKAVRLTIEEMLALARKAGLTYGVVYRVQVIHRDKFGYRDVAEKLPVDEDAVFQVASLTKNMVASAVGVLVNEGKICWDTPIKNLLPEWNIWDTTVHNLTTISDCLTRQTGLQMNNYWLQSKNNIVVPREDSMELINGLKPVKPFRGQFQYNNMDYRIAGHAWLKAAKHQFENYESTTPDLPLKQVAHILSSQIPIQSPSYHEISYGLGFARTQPPGPTGAKSAPSQLTVYHPGSHPGVLAALNLISESQIGLVILSNTLALVDIADWVGQLLIETVLDIPEKNDYLQITKDTVARALSWFSLMYKKLRENRQSHPPQRLEEYIGVYWNAVGTVHIDVCLTEGRLNTILQGLPDKV